MTKVRASWGLAPILSAQSEALDVRPLGGPAALDLRGRQTRIGRGVVREAQRVPLLVGALAEARHGASPGEPRGVPDEPRDPDGEVFVPTDLDGLGPRPPRLCPPGLGGAAKLRIRLEAVELVGRLQ